MKKKVQYIFVLSRLDSAAFSDSPEQVMIERILGVYSTLAKAKWARKDFNQYTGLGVQDMQINRFRLDDIVMTFKVRGL